MIGIQDSVICNICNMKSQATIRCYACGHISVDRCSGDGTALQLLHHHMIAGNSERLGQALKVPASTSMPLLLIGSLCIPLLHVAVMQPKLLFTDFIGCT
jgi:hypothetical protein